MTLGALPTTLTLALACALAPVGLAAQDSLVHATIDSGTLVRMHPAAGAPFQGRLVRPLTPSSPFIQFCRHPAPACVNPSDTVAIQRVPTASLIGLDVQRGTKWANGALWGALIGIAAGKLVSEIGGTLCGGETGNRDCGPSGAEYAAIGAVTFAVIGGVIGGGKPKWAPAP